MSSTPTSLKRASGSKVKNDRIDARFLAKSLFTKDYSIAANLVKAVCSRFFLAILVLVYTIGIEAFNEGIS